MPTNVMRLLSCGAGELMRVSHWRSSCFIGACGKFVNQTQRRTLVQLSRCTSSQRLLNAECKGKPIVSGRIVLWNRTLTSSVAPSSTSTSLLPGYIPEPPVPPTFTDSGTGELIEQLNALGEPTLQSLGLGSWYPNGLVQLGLESLHVGLDIPWWTSIVIGTVILRLLMFPIVILGQRNAAHTHNHSPIVQKMQADFTKAKQAGNPLEAAAVANEMTDYMKKHNVNPIKQMLIPFAQLPVFISVFVGIRQMANLPVESMATGGISWFRDLTIADPFYALPLLTTFTFLCTLEFGVDGIRADSMSRNMRYAMRAMPFVMLPFIFNFPAALLCYWLTSNICSFVQVLVLKIDPVKRHFKIPAMVKHEKSAAQEDKPFFKSIRDTYKDSKMVVDVEELRRQEAVKFKEAGLGAIQKTYSYDPTKVNKQTTVSAKSK